MTKFQIILTCLKKNLENYSYAYGHTQEFSTLIAFIKVKLKKEYIFSYRKLIILLIRLSVFQCQLELWFHQFPYIEVVLSKCRCTDNG